MLIGFAQRLMMQIGSAWDSSPFWARSHALKIRVRGNVNAWGANVTFDYPESFETAIGAMAITFQTSGNVGVDF